MDVVANKRYSWRPALSTGILFGKFPPKGLGIAIGGHFVFVPDASGATKPFPALTVNIGTGENQFFAGVIFSPTDDVQLPGGAGQVRLARSEPLPDFVLPGVKKTRHLFFGIVLKGIPITSPSSNKAPAATTSQVLLKPDVVKAGETVLITVVTNDAEGRNVNTGGATVEGEIRRGTEHIQTLNFELGENGDYKAPYTTKALDAGQAQASDSVLVTINKTALQRIPVITVNPPTSP